MVKRALIFIVFAVLASHPALARVPGDRTKVMDLRVEPFVDLVFSVLKLSLEEQRSARADGLEPAVAAAIPLRAVLPEMRTFGRIAVPAVYSRSAQELEAEFSQSPDVVRTAKGESVPLREKSIAFAKALARVEGAHLKKIWPRREAEIRRVREYVARKLASKERECIAYIAKSLGTDDMTRLVPFYLVSESPWPGAFTFRQRDGKSVCVISVSANTGTQLLEIMLHEMIHALDIESTGKGNALVEIRDRLRKAGLEPDDPDVRNVPHTLMFIQAAETIRRIVDPAHRHYGEVDGYYRRVAIPSRVELPVWIDFLDGKLRRDEAVTRMVERFLKERPRPVR